MMFSIVGHTLVLDDGKEIQFPFPIEHCLAMKNVLVVLVNPPPEVAFAENVFGVSPNGSILWQVAHRLSQSADPANCHTAIFEAGPGRVGLFSFVGVVVEIDVHTGKVLTSKFVK